jgi:hypothetical protein
MVEACGLDSSGSGQGRVMVSCKYGNDLWISGKAGNLLTSRVIISFFKKNSVPWT